MNGSVYKVHPEAVSQMRDKYPLLDIAFMVNGEESTHQNETKADALKVMHNGTEYGITVSQVSERDYAYEVTEVGMIMDTVLGVFDTVVSAIERIVEG
jgi:hypothetical protein